MLGGRLGERRKILCRPEQLDSMHNRELCSRGRLLRRSRPMQYGGVLTKCFQLIERLRGIRLRSLTFDEVRAEISAGNPIGVRIEWQGGGAHFVVIRGFRNPAGLSTTQYRRPMV